MSKKLIFDQAKGKYKVTMTDSPSQEPVEVDTKEEFVGEPKTFEKEPCKVSVGLDAKFGLPNYSSAGAFVSISIPCDEDDVDDAYAAGKEWCQEKMADITKEISGG